MLVERFRKNPKPMYYQPQFLDAKWAEYKELNRIVTTTTVDPDGFAAWGFEQLLHHRIPLYEAIARNFGYTMQDGGRARRSTDEARFHRLVISRQVIDANISLHAHPHSQRSARPRDA